MPNLNNVSLAILEPFHLIPQNLRGHVTMATAPFPKFLSGIMSGFSLRACLPYQKLIRTFSNFGTISIYEFIDQKIRGHVTLTMLLYRNFFRGHVGTFPGSMLAKLEVCNFSHFGTITILRQKFKGSRDPGHAPFSKNFSLVMSELSLGPCLPN